MADPNKQDPSILEAALRAGTLADAREASGKKALAPEGFYPDCTVNIGRTMEAKKFDDDDTPGPKYQYELTLVCPTNDVELKKYVTVTKSGKGTHFGLIKACFPVEGDRVGKSHMNCNGRKVNLVVTHKVTPRGQDYAEFLFQPVAAPVAAAPKKG